MLLGGTPPLAEYVRESVIHDASRILKELFAQSPLTVIDTRGAVAETKIAQSAAKHAPARWGDPRVRLKKDAPVFCMRVHITFMFAGTVMHLPIIFDDETICYG